MKSFFRFIFAIIVLSALPIVIYAQDSTTTTIVEKPSGATTTTVVEKRTITSPAPESVCTSVPGHWEGGVWVSTHNVCRYENRSEGVAWIQDYWSCTAATADGVCTSWALVPGHWVKTLD